jgi:L-fucose isomerase-like protein
MSQKSLIPKIGVGGLCSPLEVGADRSPHAANEMAKRLQAIGCDVVDLGVVGDADKATVAGRKLAESHVHAVVLVATSWFEDYLALDLLEECPSPLALWSLPGMETGALCGAQQLTMSLKRLGKPYQAVFGELDSQDCLQRTQTFLQAASTAYRLRRSRIGMIGHSPNGMGDAIADPWMLRTVLGPRVVPLDVPQLLALANETPNEDVQALWHEVVRRAGACRVPETDGLEAMKILAALRQRIDEQRLDALAVGCYPHLMGRACLAASLLADERIPVACEGDLHGAVGQLLLTLLTGQPTHNTDWLEPLDDGSVVFTHCGSGSFDLAEKTSDIQLAPVRLMDRGVCALFPAKPGLVTLVNIIPSGQGYQVALLEGEAMATSMVFPGNPLRVRFNRPVAEVIGWIHDEGIGHHWMAGYGHVANAMRYWASIAGSSVRVISCG